MARQIPWCSVGLALLAVACQAGAQEGARQRRQPVSEHFGPFEVRHVSVSIRRPPVDVYGFAADVGNLPRWARGLGTSYRRDGDALVADGPLGTVRVQFVERNGFGVLDHDVTLPSGPTVHNAMRVVPNGEGSEVTFVVIRRPETTNEQFAADCAAVHRDLRALRDLLEGPPGPSSPP